MPRIAAALLDDIHHSAQCTAVFSFEARRLDLDFFDEFERYVGVAASVYDGRCVLAFDKVRILSRAGSIDLIAETVCILQRFQTRARGERDHRLERTSLWD